MINQKITTLMEELKAIPNTSVELKERYSGLRTTVLFHKEQIFPITLNIEEGHRTITVLLSEDFGDFVGIETYGQPSHKMINKIMDIVNRHYIGEENLTDKY